MSDEINVTPLRMQDLTPKIILEHAHRDAGEFDDMVILGIRPDGTYQVWSTDLNTGRWAVSRMIIEDLAYASFKGLIRSERESK